MKAIRLSNVIAVWKWWFKPIHMLIFSQYFSLNLTGWRNVQIRSFLWSVFSRIRTEYREILRISRHLVRMREIADQEKLRICTLFTQCLHHLNDSPYMWNCCNHVQFSNQKIIIKYLTIKIFAWNFLQFPIQKI